MSHERRTHDSVTFFQVSTYLKFPEKSVQPSPYSGSCWFYCLENKSFSSLLCPTTWPNAIPQHSLSFPLYCAQPPASPLTAAYCNCVSFTRWNFITHAKHRTWTGWWLVGCAQCCRWRTWGWRQGLDERIGLDLDSRKEQKTTFTSKNVRGKYDGKKAHGSGSHTLVGIRTYQTWGTC